ncbi:N-acetylated-alpha-linked acidic dipeptidase 2 isoform X1 [Hydra vulgaris]|uniref:N-acetylated-alpha-linked acidic dipeptidase 2 isoform X1 n=1 Tax=Hydra vulgaris TaxID=6087 RepID=UPI000640E72B|nr:N-acetylated-alpha-linked acidic dipeptidase 2-like [Hydra vulgaris]
MEYAASDDDIIKDSKEKTSLKLILKKYFNNNSTISNKLKYICFACLFLTIATISGVLVYKNNIFIHIQRRELLNRDDPNYYVVTPIIHVTQPPLSHQEQKEDEKLNEEGLNPFKGQSVKISPDLESDRENSSIKNIFSEQKRLKFHRLVADKIYASNILENLEYLTKSGHLAGTRENNVRADWIASHFKSYNLDKVMIKTYDVLLSYPLGPGNITLFDKHGKVSEKFSVTEKILDDFERNDTKSKIYPPFLAYSASGVVEGEIVYANFGTEHDFNKLEEMGIDLSNKIVLVRYGTISRNKKIKYAEKKNVSGIILFSDPDTYAPTGVFYPDSWYLPPDGVQRGTLLRMRGDPLTRGYPSLDGLYKRPIEEVTYFPNVPVQPIGFGDAEKILKILDGASPPSNRWDGALNLTYHLTSKDKRKVRLHVNVTREVRSIKNVIGVIRGAIEPDRIIIVGNHRDAWTYGAADPSSGTAVMMEVSRALGWLKKKHGWQPRRTILICSWDAEEYGLLGSTEWAQEYAKILTHQAVAYINVDTAVQGNHTIELKSTPELVDVFFDAAKKFKDPDSAENLYTTWVRKHKEDKEDKRREPRVKMFREGSDYMPFYGDLGIPSMDFRYMFNTKEAGVFHYPVYHTLHDNIAWMKKFVDPDFRYHTTLAKVWTQVILSLADTTLLPFNFIRYSNSLKYRVHQMADVVKEEGLDDIVDFTLLKSVVEELSNVTQIFHDNLKDLDKSDALAVRCANDQMMMFERTFVTSEDIPGEKSTRHIYHTAGLVKALRALLKNRRSAYLLREFKVKYSIYTYHVMMAVHALKNPFTSFDDFN